jgi:hypothetical protein
VAEPEKAPKPDLGKLQELWRLATDQMKKRVTSLGVWQAMETAVVLDYENGTLVLGLGGENYSRAGHLEVPEHRNMIEQSLSQITQRPLSFRVVECGSVEDWEVYKVHEERKRAAQLAMLTGQRPAREKAAPAPAAAAPEAPKSHAPLDQEAVKSVDDILDRAYKLFAALPHRTLSQSRARFVRDAAQMLAAAESQLVATGMAPEAVARTIDRAIDRIAVWGECQSVTVALEYLRYKEARERQ